MSDLWSKVEEGHVAVVRRYVTSYPVKVGEIAKELGLEVIRSPLEPKISGLIQPSQQAPAGFEIKVNKYEVPERQRFTVAHELAHYLLHRDSIGNGVVDSILYRSNLTSRKETEANQLAAEIVMPRGLIRAELERLGGISTPGIAEQLATLFKVSTPAMRIRLGLS